MTCKDADDRPLVWLHGEIRTPPLSTKARLQAGMLLRCVQRGQSLPMPYSRPMPSIGPGCHELRIGDDALSWRIMYRVDRDAVLIMAVFAKKTRTTPAQIIDTCKARLRRYDNESH